MPSDALRQRLTFLVVRRMELITFSTAFVVDSDLVSVCDRPSFRTVSVSSSPSRRDASEELERRVVSVAERLGRLRRIRLDEARVALRQVDRQKVRLLLDAPDLHQSLAEIRLRVPGRVHERDEHLLAPDPLLPDVVLHDRVAAREAVLVLQPLVDP